MNELEKFKEWCLNKAASSTEWDKMTSQTIYLIQLFEDEYQKNKESKNEIS